MQYSISLFYLENICEWESEKASEKETENKKWKYFLVEVWNSELSSFEHFDIQISWYGDVNANGTLLLLLLLLFVFVFEGENFEWEY